MKNKTSPLIAPEHLGDLIRNEGVVVVDARGGADAVERFSAGHLAGALLFNLESDLSDIGPDAAKGGRHPLATPERFAEILGRAGITPSTHVLVYDDKAGANAAARFWWMLRAAAHERVQVVDGGLSAIREAGLAIATGRPVQSAERTHYPVTAWQMPLARIDDVDGMRDSDDALVIDVREGYRYKGESEPIDLVAGHIPGAINIPYLNNLQSNGRFLPPEELTRIYSEIFSKKRVEASAIHCGSGVTACHTILAMAVAGLPIPRLYVGSWSEWSRNDRPIATGENP